MSQTSGQPLTGRRLMRNTVLNAFGQGIPLVIGAAAVPVITRGIGVERLGLLALAWSLVGYFGLFDFGLGRALTQVVAERRAASHTGEQWAPAAWAALAVMAVVGLLGAAIAFAVSGWAAHSALRISPGLQDEAVVTFRILAFGIPFVVVSTGFRGILEAHERFDLVNLVRVPLGTLSFAGPLAVLPFSHRLPGIVASLVFARIAALVVTMIQCFHIEPALRIRRAIHFAEARGLLRNGAWMTVSNIVGPLLSQTDRFIIGAMLSTAVVAYYTTPLDMMTRVTNVLAAAVGAALFPAYAASAKHGNAGQLFTRGVTLTAVALFPIIVGVVLFSSELMTLWMGPTFSHESASILRMLAVGLFMNGLAQVPFALIQGVGRPDLAAKLHLIELPLYIVGAITLIRVSGLHGAAIAWTVRVGFDGVAMLIIAARLTPALRTRTSARLWAVLTAAVALIGIAGVAATTTTWPTRLALAAISSLVVCGGSWTLVMTASDRDRIRELVRLPIGARSRA